jgi:hypothetical protein
VDSLRLVEAADVDAAALERARAIFEDGFDESLRSPFGSLFADRVLVLLDGDAVAGLAVVRDLGTTGWTFLRYFVVGLRGQGIGSRFWSLLRCALAGRSRLVLDVEDPAEPGIDDTEREIRWRRIRFYERLGTAHLPVDGYQPDHGGDPCPLRLMLADLGLPQSEPTPVPDPGDLRAVVLAVYLHRYGRPGHDPAVLDTLHRSGLG